MTPSQQGPDANGHGRARALAQLDVDAHLADPARRQAFVTPMFDVIAPRYDQFTRVFSFGMDATWKREAVRVVAEALLSGASSGNRSGDRSGNHAGDWSGDHSGNDAGDRSGNLAVERSRDHAGNSAGPRVLDLACGTGDFAFSVARAVMDRCPQLEVLGIDASYEMIRFATQRLQGADADVSPLVSVGTGDMTQLPVQSASVDVVTAGYAVRNAPDPILAIREAARVLKPGGLYVTLDFYRPEFSPWRVLLLNYLAVAGNVVGWSWHRTPVVYGYIARSIDHFMSWQAFSRALSDNGFATRSVRRWLGGGVALHVAERI